ncbi:MAG: hypothetical protein K6E28_04830 [Eubacterium sp.]|nr:hypothetical protein [Eubacterium sp.]
MKRNTGVLFYDCTNFFFEIEQEAGIKQLDDKYTCEEIINTLRSMAGIIRRPKGL